MYLLSSKTLLGALCLATAGAQGVAAQQAADARTPPMDIAITYQALQANHASVPGNSFFIQGGAIELGAQVYRGLGVVASVMGEHGSASATGGGPISLVTTVFGPRYTFDVGRRSSVFGESLVGEANIFGSTLPGSSGPISNPANGAGSSGSSIALLTGGGVDFQVSRRLRFRAIQADWLRTQLPNGHNNVQNNLRLGAGIVLQFGKR